MLTLELVSLIADDPYAQVSLARHTALFGSTSSTRASLLLSHPCNGWLENLVTLPFILSFMGRFSGKGVTHD